RHRPLHMVRKPREPRTRQPQSVRLLGIHSATSHRFGTRPLGIQRGNGPCGLWGRTGSRDADKILNALLTRGPLDREQISHLFNGNASAECIAAALDVLLAARLTDCEMETTGGRPRESVASTLRRSKPRNESIALN